MISQQTIQKVKDLPIEQIVEKYHQSLKKAGVNYKCHCPWHNEKNPSFIVSPSKGIAKCFSCDHPASNSISFVQELLNLDFPQAIETIANDFGIQVIKTFKKEATEEELKNFREMEALYIANSWAADWYHNQLLALLEKYFPEHGSNIYLFDSLEIGDFKQDVQKVELAYILERFGGNIELIKKFKIGYAPTGYNNLVKAAKKAATKPEALIKAGLAKQKETGVMDCFVFRPLIFPIINQKNKVAGFSARKMPWEKNEHGNQYPKFINTSETKIYNKSKLLYGFDFETQGAIKTADKVYIVEGNTDKTSLYGKDIINVVAKSGTALTDHQIDALKLFTKHICLIDDGDNAGQLSMQKNGEKLTKAGCFVSVLTLPDGEDPDSFFSSKEQFYEFEKENEKDYIIDIRAVEELEGAGNNIQAKKKVRQSVAELLLNKSKDDRAEYISEITKRTRTTAKDWNAALSKAAFAIRNKGINITEEQGDSWVEPDNSTENKRKHDFYFVKKDKKGNPAGIDIDGRKFLNKLKSMQEWEFETKNGIKIIYFGFYIYTLSNDDAETMFIQLHDGKIRKVSIHTIKKTFFEYIKLLKPIEYSGQNNEYQPWEKTITNKDLESLLITRIGVFEEKKLILYPDRKINILQDSFDKHYTFFQNCFIISSKNGYQVNEYGQLKDGYVWDDAVLDREYHEPKDDKPGVFEQFVHDISGNEWDLEKGSSRYPEKARYKAMLIAGGYALHNFTEMKRKAVILTQGRLSEEDTSEGREGKTLFIKSLGRFMLNKDPKKSKTFVMIPGKDLKGDDKHKWQDVEMNTTCVLYDDPPPWISIESLYNVAEEAFKVEKKNQDNIYVEARIFICTNRPFDRDSGSSKDRTCVIELDSIFDSEYSPEDKYEHFFFRDWAGDMADEWNKFSKYVLGKMLPEYFRNKCRLLEPPSKNLHRNELLQVARKLTKGTEIVFWLDYLCQGDELNEPHFKKSEIYRSKDLYPDFLEFSGQADDKILKRNFTPMLKKFFEKEGIQAEWLKRDSSGSRFQIISGLPSRIKVDNGHIKEFFNNGYGYKLNDIHDETQLQLMTDDFNDKFNTSVNLENFKSAVEKLINDEMPFNN